MSILLKALNLYVEHFGKLILLAVSFVLPLLIVHNLLVNYAYLRGVLVGNHFFPDVVNSFIMIVFLMLAQLPFIHYIHADQEGEEHCLRSAYYMTFKHAFSVYLFGIVFALLMMMGFVLLVIPGIIMMVLLYLTPYITILKDQPTRKSWRSAIELGKNHFFPLLGFIILLAVLEMAIGAASLIGALNFTDSYLYILVIQGLLNLLFLPFFTTVMTLYVRKITGFYEQTI